MTATLYREGSSRTVAEIKEDPSISVYPSKVDYWLAATLIGTPIFVISLGISLTLSRGAAGLVCLVVGMLVGALIAALSIPCRYILEEDALVIRSGFLVEKIRYDRIIDATTTVNPMSAPALSLSRVKIELNQGFRLISPKSRDTFISELKERITDDGAGIAPNA